MSPRPECSRTPLRSNSEFHKISQNLHRRCPPCRCLHAQCSRTPLRSNFEWCRILFFCILDWFGMVYCTFLHPPCIFHNFSSKLKENRGSGGSGVTCLEHCKFKENQENPRKFNRAEAPAASATIRNHRKSFKFLPNSFQISIWASLGFSKPLKSLRRESGLPKPENSWKITEKWTNIVLHGLKPL